MNISSDYYIEEEYTPVAGPYDYPKQKDMMIRVIIDLVRGEIDYRVAENFVTKKIDGVERVVHEKMIERRGMILPKR